MKSKIILLAIFGAILISSVTTTQTFAQGYGNTISSHFTTQMNSCYAAPSPNINWSNCKVGYTNIHFADLAWANLSGMVVTNGLFYNVNLSGANLRNATMTGASFAYSDLSGADLRGADLRDADFYHANLSGADLSGANLQGARFTGVDFSNANLEDQNMFRTNIIGADLTSTNMQGVRLEKLGCNRGKFCKC